MLVKTRSDPFPRVSYDDWRRRVEEELGEESFEESLVSRLPSGVAVEPLYTAEFPTGRPHRADRLDVESKRSWLPCQLFTNPDLTKLAEELRTDLEGGVIGVWLRLDRAARLGELPETSSQNVGRDGTTLYRLQDLHEAFRRSSQEWRLLLLEPGGSFLPVAAAILAWFEKTEIDPGDRTLILGGDPLGALARDGSLPGPLRILERDLAELVRYCDSVPGQGRALVVSVASYREAGADTAQELGLAMASSVHYLRALEREGVEVQQAAGQLAFVTAIGQDIFVEMAKLRALRLLWNGVLKSCGVEDPPRPWIHGTILCRDLTSQNPWSNQLRATSAGFAAVMGGVNSLEIPAFDESDGSESLRGRRLARNIQHILGEESHLHRVTDTSGGSYYVERLTQDLMRAGWGVFQQVEAEGGMLAALQSGWVQKQVDESRQNQDRESDGSGEGSSSQADLNRRQRVTAVLERYTQQGETAEAGEISSAPAENRLRWCIEHLRRGASIQDLSRALYQQAGGQGTEL